MVRPIYYGWVIIGALFVVNFAIQATGMFNLGLFVIPMCHEMGISRGQFGWFATVRLLSGGVSVWLLGRIVDRIGSRILIPCSAVLTGLFMMGIGASAHVLYLVLLFSMIGFSGLSAGGGGIFTMVPVAKWFVRRRGLALGISTLGIGLGAVTFVPVTQFLIDSYGWRMAWVLLAIIMIVLIVPVSSIVIRRQPEDMNLLPDGASDADEVTYSQSNGVGEAVWTVSEAIRTRAFWLINAALLLWGMANGGAVHRMAFWIGLGFDPRLVSFVFTIDAVCFTIMTFVAGVLLDRIQPRFIQAGAFAGIMGAVFLMVVASHTYHMLLSVIFFGLAAGTTIISQTYLWAYYYGRAFLGAIRGVTLPFFLAAASIGAPLTGYIFDYTGSYQAAWKLFIGVYFIGFLCILAVKPPTKKPVNSENHPS